MTKYILLEDLDATAVDAKIAELTELVQARRFVKLLPKKGTRNARKAARKRGMKNMGKREYLTMKFHLKRATDELRRSKSAKTKLLRESTLDSPRKELSKPEPIEAEMLERQVFMMEDIGVWTNQFEERKIGPWVPITSTSVAPNYDTLSKSIASG